MQLPVYSNGPSHGNHQGHGGSNTFPAAHGLQRARSPQSAARSPIHDRAPPIQLLDPQTGRMVNVKPSRTSATAAPLHSGSSLCRDFLERSGCQAGAYCSAVHVMGREHIWESINPAITDKGTYVRGFHVSCYDPNMVKYLSLPSETVTPTSGSANYISMFNEHGENFKARFQVCKMMYDVNSCASSGSCSDIHTSLKDFSGVLGQETHVCDEETLSLYRRLPEDVTVRVYQQNSTDDFHEYSGDKVLLTLGAQQYLDAFLNEGRRIPRKKMQHCAHFRLKHLCRMGPGCKFIHVISREGMGPIATTNPLDEDIDTALASQSSHPRMESPRSGTDSPIMTEVNVIVRERARGAGYRSPLSINSVGNGSMGSRTTSPQLPPNQPKSKSAMGPGDVAAMLAMRINNNSGILAAGSPMVPPTIEAIVAPARSPTRINNPYQQPMSGSSSGNSSFSEAKVSGGARPSSAGAQPYVTSNASASSPYAPNYSNATVHAVPAPPNTADQGYSGFPASPHQPYSTQQPAMPPPNPPPQQYQPYATAQGYPQQQQQQQQRPAVYPPPQQQQQQQYGSYPADYSHNGAATGPGYQYPQHQQPQQQQQQQYYAPPLQQPTAYDQQQQQLQQGYPQHPSHYPQQQQQQQQPSSYQPYPNQQQYSGAGYTPQYTYQQQQQPQQPPPQHQQQQQQAQHYAPPQQQRQQYPQQPPNNGQQNWS